MQSASDTTATTDSATTDVRHIWHPYSPVPGPRDNLHVSGAEGVNLTLADGRVLIDAMSSWWAAAHGHRHPDLIAAAHRQLDILPHVMFGGLTHTPAVDLTDRLLTLTGEAYRDCPGDDLSTVFFADSGSVAVEVAIKAALQTQRGCGHPERRRLLTWRSGYHGDTFGAMSVCDPDGGMHSLWSGTLTEQIFVPAPPVRGSSDREIVDYLRGFEAHIDDTVAAVIIEPVVQGAGGMRFHDHSLVAGVRRICDAHGVLLIADEIATGFGRTGDLFTTAAAGIIPDILCVGKALTGGMLTLAAVLTTTAVSDAVSSPAGGGALMHGPTFMANPLACTVATAAMDLVTDGYWRSEVPRIEDELRHGLCHLADLDHVADVRVLGAVGVVELTTALDDDAMTDVQDAAVAHGVWLRPFGRLIYCMPPFISTTGEVATICRAVAAAVAAAEEVAA
jgi:adenosylmethionine-8-amino-7-oxononanoate aminotransferase